MNEMHRDSALQELFTKVKVEKLLNKAKIQGPIDFAVLSNEEQQQVLEWYMNHFTEVESGDRTEILENVLMRTTVNETVVLNIALTLADEQKRELGLFLGSVLKNARYVKAVQHCWNRLSYDEQQTLIHYYTQIEPEQAVMIAKYVDVTKITYEIEGKKQTLAERSFRTIEQATLLLNQLLEIPASETQLEQDKRMEKLRNAVTYIGEVNPLFLVGHLDQLISLKVIRENTKERILNAKSYAFIEVGSELLPQEDRTKLHALENEFSSKYGIKKELIDLFTLADSTDPIAQELLSYWSKTERVFIVQQIKAAKAFPEYQSPSGLEGYLRKLKERNGSIFLALPELDLEPQQVLDLMQKKSIEEDKMCSGCQLDDLTNLLSYFSTHDSIKAEGHRLILEELLQSICDYQEDDLGHIAFAKNIESFLPYFSQTDQKRIIETISENAPDLWLYCWEFAVKNGYCDPEGYLDASIETSPKFIIHYKKIESYFRAKQEFEKAETIVQLVKNNFEQWPSDTLYSNNQSFKDAYPRPEDRLAFYQRHLSPPANPHLVTGILRGGKEHEAFFLIPKAFLEDPHLFSQVIDMPVVLDQLFSIYSWDSIKSMILPDFDRVNCVIFDSHLFLSHLSQDTKFLNQFLKQVETTNQVSVIASLHSELRLHLNKRTKQYKPLPYELADPFWSVSKSDMESTANKLKDRLIRKAEKIPGFIFEGETIVELQEKADIYILRDIDLAVEQDPLVLSKEQVGIIGIKKIIEVIGETRYHALVMKHHRKLQFRRDQGRVKRSFDLTILSSNNRHDLFSKDPIGSLTAFDQPTVRFYQESIDILASYKLFPFFKKKLEELAQFEREQKQGKEDQELYRLNTQFTSLADQIVLFELSPLSALIDQSSLVDVKDPSVLKRQIQLITFLSFHGLDEPTQQTDAWKELEDRAKQKIQMILNIEQNQVEHIQDLDMETIEALGTYVQLHASKNPALNKTLSTVIQHVLNGTFEEWRMWGGHPDQPDKQLDTLKEQQLLPKQLTLEQYNSWTSEQTGTLEDEFKLEANDLTRSIKNLIEQAVSDGHIDKTMTEFNHGSLERELKQLQEPLVELMAKKQVIDKRIQEIKQAKKSKTSFTPLSPEEETEHRELQQSIQEYRSDHAEDFAIVHAKLSLEQLKRIDVQNLQSMSLTVGKDKVVMKRAFQIMENYFEKESPDFIQDLRRIQKLILETNEQLFGGKTVSKKTLSLTDRVDAKTHLFIGEQPVTSCQSYKGNTDNARGLASYLSDPNVKFIQLLDEEGQIQARAAIRLLEDEEGNPHLFMERVYSTNMHPKIIDALSNFGKTKAEQMGIPFHSEQSQKKRLEKKVRLFSYNSRAPYVYTDAGGGLRSNGRYSISV